MPFEITDTMKARLEQVCEKFYVRKLSIFGSTLHRDARPDSDLDVLVEFKPGHVPGFGFVTLRDQLSDILGRNVDLRTPEELSKYFRDTVVREAQQIYAGT